MLNIGNPGVKAARELKGNPHWQGVCDAVLEQTRVAMNKVLDNGHEVREFGAGYAAALRDLWVAFESATNSAPINQVAKPSPVRKGE